MSELQKYTYEIDIEHRSLRTSEGEAAYDGQKFYDACDSDAARAADQATIAELRERLARCEAALRSYTETDEYREGRHDPYDPCAIRFKEAIAALAAEDGGQDGGAQ